MSANLAADRPRGIRNAVFVGIAGLCVLSGSVLATTYFTRPNVTAQKPVRRDARAEGAPQASGAARDSELSALKRRLARLETSERAKQEATAAPVEPANERQAPPQPEQSPEEVHQQVLRSVERLERRFVSQGARSDWGVTKEQELRTTVAGLGEEQGGRVRSLDCRESMCRMEIEHDSARQAMAFLEEAGFRAGLGGALSTRLRPALDEERYIFYIEPRKPSGKVTMR